MMPQMTDMRTINPLNLKDCPFCGGDDVSLLFQRGLKRVECNDCHARTQKCDNKENAINRWQERPND